MSKRIGVRCVACGEDIWPGAERYSRRFERAPLSGRRGVDRRRYPCQRGTEWGRFVTEGPYHRNCLPGSNQ